MMRLYPRILKAEQNIYQYQKELLTAETQAEQQHRGDSTSIKQLRDELAEAERECANLTSDLRGSEDCGQELRMELAQARGGIEELRSELSHSESKNADIAFRIEKQRQERLQDLERMSRLELELREFRELLGKATIERKDHNAHLTKGDQDRADLRKLVAQLSLELRVNDGRTDHLESMATMSGSRLDTADAMMSEVMVACDRGESESAACVAMANGVQADCVELRQQLSAAEEQAGHAADAFHRSEEDQSELWGVVSRLESAAAEHSEALDSHKNQIFEGQVEVQFLKDELDAAAEARMDLWNSLELSEAKQDAEGQAFLSHLADVDSVTTALSDRAVDLEKDAGNLRQMIMDAEKENRKTGEKQIVLGGQMENLRVHQRQSDERLEEQEKRCVCVIM